MSHRALRLLVAPLALAATSAQAAGPAATSAPAASGSGCEAPQVDVPALFDKGVTAHDQGKLADARECLGRAFTRRQSWEIATNLGIVEHEMHDDVAAAEHLSFALRTFPVLEEEATRRSVEKELAAALAGVAQITVHTGVDGAEVRVAGQRKGVTPLEGPLFAAPGVVTVDVAREGYEPASRTVTAKAGAAVDVTFLLAKRPVGPERSWAAPAVAFGFGGLGLVTGVVAGAFAAGRMADLRATCTRGLVCPQSVYSAAEDGRAAAHLATAGFVLAGIGAAVGLGLVAIPIRGTPARVGLSIGPGSVSLKGAF